MRIVKRKAPEKNYNENIIFNENFIKELNVSFCAVASVGKLCFKKLMRKHNYFKKAIERFWQEAILHNV